MVWPCQVPEEPFIQVPLREYDGQPQPASPGRQGEPPGTAPGAAAPPLPHPAFPAVPAGSRCRQELGPPSLPPSFPLSLPTAAPGSRRWGAPPRAAGGGVPVRRGALRYRPPRGWGKRGPWCGLGGHRAGQRQTKGGSSSVRPVRKLPCALCVRHGRSLLGLRAVGSGVRRGRVVGASPAVTAGRGWQRGVPRAGASGWVPGLLVGM